MKEEGRRKKEEEGRRKKEEGRRKKEEEIPRFIYLDWNPKSKWAVLRTVGVLKRIVRIITKNYQL
jgi:hypothetical protein